MYADICHGGISMEIAINVTSVLYVFQLIMLLGILFFRLYLSFRATAFTISKCTIWSFSIYYSLTSICGVFGAISVSTASTLGQSILGGTMGLTLLLALWLICLFLYKLTQIYKASKSKGGDDELVRVITKTSLLCFISTLNSILSLSIIPYSISSTSIHVKFVAAIVNIIDIYTNFLCIYLSYTYFARFYALLCGCCDMSCQYLWNKCTDTMPVHSDVVLTRIHKSNTVESTNPSTMEETEITQSK